MRTAWSFSSKGVKRVIPIRHDLGRNLSGPVLWEIVPSFSGKRDGGFTFEEQHTVSESLGRSLIAEELVCGVRTA